MSGSLSIRNNHLHYVDNAATGANNGTSWADAWESFADISWGSVAPGDTVYISGGSSSKTYQEQLRPQASGSTGSFITITVGANSPSPSGHQGTVIIDGNATISTGILCYSDASYVRFYGYDSSNNYRWVIQNIEVEGTGIGVANPNHVYVDYMKVFCPAQFGINFYYASDSRIKGCYVDTGDSDENYGVVCIYTQGGANNIIENNIAIQNTHMTYPPNYGDVIQFYNTSNLICRNNYLEWVAGAGNNNCAVMMSELTTNDIFIYNNVLVGSSEAGRACIQFTSIQSGALYLWNNTIVTSNSASDGVIRLQNLSDAKIGAIKNNIIYTSSSGMCTVVENSMSDATKINNNCLYTGGTNVSQIAAVNRTWAQHQAAGYDANGLNVDPDLDSGDEYRLNATSDCIDAGADLSAYFTTDRDGNTRPVGQWDIGAYEYIAP